MFLTRHSRLIAVQQLLLKSINAASFTPRRSNVHGSSSRGFQSTRRLDVVVPVNLADIGEGKEDSFSSLPPSSGCAASHERPDKSIADT